MTGRAVRHRSGITDRNDYGLLLTGQQLAQLDQQAARCAVGSRSGFVGRALGRHVGIPDA